MNPSLTGSTKHRLSLHPPGPWNMLGASGLTWRHACQMVFSPLSFSRHLADTYGGLSFFRLFARRGYLVNDPDLIAQVLIHQADHFQRLPRQMNVIRQIFGQGLLVSEGQQWLQDRRLLQKAFGKSLSDRSANVTADCTRQMLQRWQSSDQPLDLLTEMTRLTAQMASRLFTGEDDPDRIEGLSRAVIQLSDVFSHEMNSAWTMPSWFPSPANRTKQQSLSFYFQWFNDLVQRRRSGSLPNNDLLQYLLDHQPDLTAVRDQLLTIMVAAYHASANALVWVFHMLEEHPEIEERLIEEQAVPSLQPDQYLQAVISETLRLYPPAWSLFARQSIRDVSLAGYEIPAGGWFYIFPFVTHRTEAYFPHALRFDPDRFLGQRRQQIHRHAYLPFGLGPRACIGNRLAMKQMQQIVGLVLRQGLIRRVPGQRPVVPMARLSLRPRDPFWIRLHPSPLSEHRPMDRQITTTDLPATYVPG